MKATATLGPVDFETKVNIRQHIITADEPAENGGQDKGPGPREYVCAALATCTIATLKMYLNHKQMKLNKLSVDVELTITEDKKNIFKRTISIEGEFDASQKERILAVANKCPVHKMLEGSNTIETVLT